MLDKAAIMMSANNMLHYPFVAAFAQARARQEGRRAMDPSEKDPELQAMDDAMLSSHLDMGAPVAALRTGGRACHAHAHRRRVCMVAFICL